MKTKSLIPLAGLVLVAAWSGLLPATPANAQPTCECCPLGLPSAPSNTIDFTLSWAYPPALSASFMTATVLAGGAVSPGVYASWCADAQTALLPGTEGFEYSARLYAVTDPNLNEFLAMETSNTNVLVGPDIWHDVNYLLNHDAGYNFWDVQGAIWHFVGGPAVATPPYPLFNQTAVNQLVSDTTSNAAAWCPQAGDKVAVLAAINWPVDNQIIIIEMPCPGTTPALAVSVSCPTDCGPADFSGSVTNDGNVTLTNVQVFSDQPANNTLLLGPISLAAGASATFNGTYVIPCVTNLTTNMIGVVTTNTAGVVTTNLVSVVTTNMVGVVTTNIIPVITTNTVGVVMTNMTAVITTNSVSVVTTNTAGTITTNMTPVVTTNFVTVITTNNSGTITTNIGAATFGTIDPVSGILTDRFTVPPDLHGLMFADQDENWGATLFYTIREPATGADEFDTISTIPPSVGVVTDRFALSSTNYDALTLAAPDVGYGAINFYYLRHDFGGAATFGEIIAQGVSSSADLWPVANTGYTGLAFAAANVGGYGANLFYYVRQDVTGLSTFGTINPTPGGIETDLYTVGSNLDSLVFVPGAVSTWGTAIFAYLRHDNVGSIIGTIDPVTHVATDRIDLGTNFLNALTFTATDVGYGPNLFYYLRPGGLTLTTNTVSSLSTNTVASLTTNIVTSFTTNTTTSFTTNIVTSFATNIITTFSTNNATSFTTNNVTSLGTNIVTSFTTNMVTTFTTNFVTTFSTNTTTSFITNILAGVITNTVTASGMDVCQGRTVTPVATCSGPVSQLVPLVIGGGGVPPPSHRNGNFSWSFATQNGVTYTVQYKNSWNDPAWTNLQIVAGTGGVVTISQPMAGQPACFYRLMISP